MANIYQQAAKRRKLIYLASIGVLLILSLVVRGTFFGIDRRTVDEVNASSTLALTLDGRAKVHELTELQQGDKELGGAAIQLLLTGSRGLGGQRTVVQRTRQTEEAGMERTGHLG